MATFGYGPRTFIPQLARIACRLEAYMVKHDKTLKTYLPAPAYTCVTSVEPCLLTLCALKNQSER